ncbi:ankyrin repeat protein, putative [Trichomonas vaginalis G3]|uniref:Ankyrin repeat protein, putative n=1 Tax=Trichomonas vaginalis (strain ATCC PRA-98 / G3) TaxID=412133 RepID=A2DNH9_TRIV3|nr:ankyrin repeat and SOCS box-containing protein 4 family [Trichomonas vaginalis G3]EAY17982.1 ankyrin repeat protein, putative [Trichomonas vaginalis G3]KAI5499066.1 ankyrin repeat and SOCS box-containing protein 4 family [Trichomonas vaginalis G3]|eukprot:XP_001578968.1 ankyrin repeat protein [Trichomonas vaginalis G3]
MIKTEMIDSTKYLPKDIMRDILGVIPYNYRYAKSFLFLAKLISDDYHVSEISNIPFISNYLFNKEYKIKLDKSQYFKDNISDNLNILTENTIYRAIIHNDLEVFITFTEREGFDKDQQLKSSFYPNFNGKYSLLELCCYHGAVDCFKLLISKFSSEITYQCLEFSFLGGNPDKMSECLKYYKPNWYCMKYAIISHNIDFVTFLMNEYNIQIDLCACADYNNLDSFLAYFDQTNDVNNCFFYSTKFNIPSLCEYFLSLGVDINTKVRYNEIALHYAAENNRNEIAEFLISHGANINDRDANQKTPLYVAVLYNSKETAELLLSHGANINEKDNIGQTALHVTANYNIKLTELLISYGANINEKDRSGKTALYVAADFNRIEIAEFLLSHGADVNIKDEDGQTALHVAASKSDKMTELLISYGANINEKDKSGRTALHIAAENNRIEIAEFLLSHDANINDQDEAGQTCLHHAACNDSKETAELLLTHGVNINEKDKFGKTALFVAAENASREIFLLLIAHSPKINKKDECRKKHCSHCSI